MDQATFQRLLEQAKGGDTAAQEQVALTFEAGELPAEALEWMDRAASAGRPSAIARVGLWQLVGYGGQRDPAVGVRNIVGAAEHGNRFGLHLAGIVFAGGVGAARDIPRALGYLERGAEQGGPRAMRQHELLSAPGALESLTASCEPRVVRDDPRIQLIDDFLPGWACDYVMELSGPVLTRGKVVDQQGGESVSGERTNTVMNFGLVDSDVLLELINNRIAEAAGMPTENAEGLGVLHYAPGERYAPHVDYIPDTHANRWHLEERGQRVRTFLVYLNEGFEGGETQFPRLDLAFKPGRGGALIFDSVKPGGAVDPMTLHTGAPPTRGEKWIISKWFRTKALRPGPGA